MSSGKRDGGANGLPWGAPSGGAPRPAWGEAGQAEKGSSAAPCSSASSQRRGWGRAGPHGRDEKPGSESLSTNLLWRWAGPRGTTLGLPQENGCGRPAVPAPTQDTVHTASEAARPTGPAGFDPLLRGDTAGRVDANSQRTTPPTSPAPTCLCAEDTVTQPRAPQCSLPPGGPQAARPCTAGPAPRRA